MGDSGAAPHDTSPPDLSGLRILVVEDNEDNRELVTTYLDLCGAAVLQATDVDTAISYVGIIKLDALVSDLALHGQTGFDLIKRIRSAGPPNSTLIAIALSGLATTEEAVLAAGYDVYFMKPVDLDAVCAAILNRCR